MEQELERIFRLMALLLPQAGLHDAYVGVRSSNPTVRANALEFLDNVLKPELRHVLVPLLDAQVTVEERIEIANRLVGAPLETPHQAVATLLASEDPWLRSCAIQAVGTLQAQRPRAGAEALRSGAGSAGPRSRRRRAGPAGRRFARACSSRSIPRPRISISASARVSDGGQYSDRSIICGGLASALARPHQPLDPERHRRRHAVRAVGQIALEIGVG